MLSAEEREELNAAEGKWPGLAHAILELSERHPVLPPPGGQDGVTRYRDLPPEFRVPRRRLASALY